MDQEPRLRGGPEGERGQQARPIQAGGSVEVRGAPQVLQVVILRDGLLVGTEVFVPGTYTLGSSAQADLRLDDATVGEQHAILYFRNGRAAVQDGGAPSGLYVNGHRVTACEIRPVDEVMCGPFVLKTRVLAQQPAPRTAPPPELAALLALTPAKGSAQASPAAAPKSRPAAAPYVQPPQATVPSIRRRQQAVAAAPPPGASPARPPRAAPPPPATGAPAEASFRDDRPTLPSTGPATLLAAPPAPPAARPSRPAAKSPPVAPQRQRPSRAAAPPPPEVDPAPTPIDLAPLEAALAGPLEADPEPPAGASAAGPRTVRVGPGRKGRPRLYLELYWGPERRWVQSFRPTVKRPVRAAAREDADFPLYGFTVGEEDTVLAAPDAQGLRLFVPPGARVESCPFGGPFSPARTASPEGGGAGRSLRLEPQTAYKLTHGGVALVAFIGPRPERPFANPFAGAPWLALGLVVALATGFGGFLQQIPERGELPDFSARDLAPVAVRLVAPEPKRNQEAQKKLAEIKARAKPTPKKTAKRAEQPPARKTPPKQAPSRTESPALRALAKLSAAGPASGDILAAVDKLGNGPGSKKAKASNFKVSGMIGKAPIANAGLGSFGLGGGGKGGMATLGGEVLRGKGGGGVGALGAGSLGKKRVGGTVTRATARTVAVKGSIDREAVAKVVNAHLQEVRACYERALLRQPSIAGKVVLEWSIATTGKVASVRTKSSTLQSSEVESCILRSLRGWVFPPPRGGTVIVTYPFLFNSVGY